MKLSLLVRHTLGPQPHVGTDSPGRMGKRRGTRRNSWSTGVVGSQKRRIGMMGWANSIRARELVEYSMPLKCRGVRKAWNWEQSQTQKVVEMNRRAPWTGKRMSVESTGMAFKGAGKQGWRRERSQLTEAPGASSHVSSKCFTLDSQKN